MFQKTPNRLAVASMASAVDRLLSVATFLEIELDELIHIVQLKYEAGLIADELKTENAKRKAIEFLAKFEVPVFERKRSETNLRKFTKPLDSKPVSG